MKLPVKKPLLSFLFLLAVLTCLAQGVPALEQLKADPKKAYGNDYPYLFETVEPTRAPRGYKPFYINWETCKAANIQLVFYRGRKPSDPVLVKCMLNGFEASLPIATDMFPYYRWNDLRDFYTARCNSNK